MGELALVMPKMGESVTEGTILSWLKQPGDKIVADEAVLEVATDKVDTEVPAPEGGVLKKILAKKGDVVPVGKPIAILEVENLGVEGEPSPPLPSNGTKVSAAEKTAPSNKRKEGRFYSPLVRSISKKEGLSQEILDKIPGTGAAGRLTKKDLQAYLEKRSTAPLPTSDVPSPPIATEEAEIIEMDRMRQIIASRMLESKQTSPHVTSFVEADVTALMRWKSDIKRSPTKETQPITLTPIFVHTVARALQDFPMVNVSVSGNNIIRHKNIHIGVAVALPTGNLIVPVLHNADQLSLRGLILRFNELVRQARKGKLQADDLSNGTYTVSNVGTFGNLMGTPIIMQPQAAIMAFGVVRKRAVVITDDKGQDMIAVRQIMYLSHSYDHRVIDGALGGMFAKRVADYLKEAPREKVL